MIEPKEDYLKYCPVKKSAFANPKVETVADVERLVNIVLERNLPLRREALSPRNPLQALRMALTQAKMVHYLYVDPETQRSVLLFGRKDYIKTPQQFADWIENHPSIRANVQSYTR